MAWNSCAAFFHQLHLANPYKCPFAFYLIVHEIALNYELNTWPYGRCLPTIHPLDPTRELCSESPDNEYKIGSGTLSSRTGE